jgi:hypothetical protein
MTAQTMATALLGEQLIRGLDIARAANSPWSISCADALQVIAGVMAMTPDYVGRRQAAGLHVSYELRIRGGPRYRLMVQDGTAAITGPGHKVDCWISADPVAFLLIGYGRTGQWGQILPGKDPRRRAQAVARAHIRPTHHRPVKHRPDRADRDAQLEPAADHPHRGACHAVSLVAGQGASLAIAGAFVLAEQLHRAHSIEAGLKAYEQKWRPVIEESSGRHGPDPLVPPHSASTLRLSRLGLQLAGLPLINRYIATLLSGKPTPLNAILHTG